MAVGYARDDGWPAGTDAAARPLLQGFLEDLGYSHLSWSDTPTGWMMRPGLDGMSALHDEALHWHGGEYYGGTSSRLTLHPAVHAAAPWWTESASARQTGEAFAQCLADRDDAWSKVGEDSRVTWWAANDRIAYQVQVFVETCGVVHVSVDAATGWVLGHDGIHNNCVA